MEKMVLNVRGYRVAYGITQEQMAKQLGVATRTYQRKENGEADFTIKEFRKIYKVFTKYNSKISAGTFFLKA